MVTVLRVISWLILSAGIALFIVRLIDYYRQRTPSYGDEKRKVKKLSLSVPVLMFVVGLSFLLVLTGATQVPATHIAVVENTVTGEFYSLEPGTHIWPFSPKLVPLITKVTKYDLRRQIIEIGADPVSEKGVQADSNSPGRPVVFFWARGWAYPNQEKIVELHRKYGETYLDDWVERVWVSTLKAVQGARPYDFVGNNRELMQSEVELALQSELNGDGEIPLVYVSQLAIADYNYDANVNAFLNAVAEKEFQRQQSEQQILINKKNQEAATIQAETDFLVAKRAAESNQVKVTTEAQGNATAQMTLADAAAYEIAARYTAESAGIQLVQGALARSPQAYLTYLQTKQWDGKYPYWYNVGGSVPVTVLPLPGTTITETVK